MILNLSSFPRAIAHIDCDAFFTSVEQALHPELRGKPVVTGKERGIVACASYEAKALGVKRPMRLFEAKKTCKELVCLPSDYENYSLFSKRMNGIIRSFTPTVEEYSIDEVFAEFTGLRRMYHTNYLEILWRVKNEVQKELGITVSVGLSLTKSLAKLASKEEKPNGFVAVRGRDIQDFLKKMPLERVWGFGPNITALLERKGLRSVLDYVLKPKIWAKQTLGKIGVELWHELRGESVYEIETEEKNSYSSISKTKTFTPASSDRDFVRAQLLRNLESAFIKLRRHKLRAKCIAVFLRTQDFKSSGLEGSLTRSTRSTLEAVHLADDLFNRLFSPDTLYRLTGVVLSKIENDDSSFQYDLFESPAKVKSLRAVDRALDQINGTYGKHTIHLGTSLWLGKHRQHVNERGDVPKRKQNLFRGENFRQRLGIPLWGLKV